jgi:hypothetical protein
MRDAGAPPDSREWGAVLQALVAQADWAGVAAAIGECVAVRGEVVAEPKLARLPQPRRGAMLGAGPSRASDTHNAYMKLLLRA